MTDGVAGLRGYFFKKNFQGEKPGRRQTLAAEGWFSQHIILLEIGGGGGGNKNQIR